MGLCEAWMISIYCLFDFFIMSLLQEFFKEPDIQLNQINSMAKAEVMWRFMIQLIDGGY